MRNIDSEGIRTHAGRAQWISSPSPQPLGHAVAGTAKQATQTLTQTWRPPLPRDTQAQPTQPKNQGPHRLVVRTSRRGRDRPGSTPGVDMYCGSVRLNCVISSGGAPLRPPSRSLRTPRRNAAHTGAAAHPAQSPHQIVARSMVFRIGRSYSSGCGMCVGQVCWRCTLVGSKALAQGASPQGRGFEPHSCQLNDSAAAPCSTTCLDFTTPRGQAAPWLNG